jgi:hypothetical protein
MDQTWGLTCRQLSAESVAALPPGWAPYWVAPNLYLRKAGQAVGFWPLMYASPVKGHRVEMGLDPARDPRFTGLNADATGLSLREAKTKALEYRAQIVRGVSAH